MTDYKNGLIYTIRSPHTDNIYIGSTCQRLSKRLYTHKNNFRQHKNGAIKYMTSYKILELGDEYIELLEACPCNSKIELHKREGELIREYRNICVNKSIAGRTDKQYRMENKEKIALVDQKRYYNNIDREHERKRKYREQNKDKFTERHNCECGGHYTINHKARHEKSKKHLDFMKQ